MTNRRTEMFERIAAARTLADGRHDQEAMELAAFMDIFHPGHPMTDALVREKRQAKRKTRKSA